MISPSDDPRRDVQTLRRCINDLVSLLALPAIWTGQEPDEILKIMAESLLGMLRLDFIFSRVSAPSGDLQFEVARVAGQQRTAEEIRAAFDNCLKDDASGSPLIMKHPFAQGEIRVLRFSLGLIEQTGLVIVGSERPDFPSQTESILLQVGVNQTAIALTGAMLASRRLKAEEALARQLTVTRTITENSTQALLMIDKRGYCTFMNPAAEKMFGFTFEQMRSRTLHEMIHHHLPDGTPYPREQCLVDKPSLRENLNLREKEDIFIRKNGEFFPVLVEASPIFDEQRNPVSTVLEIRDITERRQSELKLRQQTEVVETINRIGRTLSAELDTQKLVQTLTDAATVLTGAAFGSFFYNVLNEQGESFMLYTLSGVPREAFANFPMPRNTDLFGPTFRGERVIRIGDVRQDPRYGKNAPYYGMPPGHLPVRSYLAVPVVSRTGGVMGGLFFGHHETNVFTERHEQILEGLAAQAAIAIDNARLFEQVQNERAKAEAMQRVLADRVEEMESIMEVLPVGLLISQDRDATQIVGNRAARKFLRMDHAADSNLSLSAPSEIAPTHFRVVREGREVSSNDLPVQRAAKQGIAIYNEELDILFNDGVVRHGRISALPLFDQNNNSRGAVASILDITNQKKAEKEREQHLMREKSLRAEAESANTLKDEFLATISHELRTPLNAILGWARILTTNKVDPPVFDRAMESIERSARTQARLIEDLLDVSGIMSGKMRLDVQPVDLLPVVQAAIDSVRPAADAKSMHLQVILDPAAGPVSGDPTRLQQIFWNLLSNAIKFTPKDGRIQVRLERVNSHVQITVTDNGIGIRPNFLPFLFDRFRQADSSITRSQPGLGLGLSIVRHLVELHGGEVHAYSGGEGKGAIFTVNLPLLIVRDVDFVPPEIAQQDPPMVRKDIPFDCPPALNGLRILIVDDEPDARDVLSTILRRCKAEVCAVAAASEAFEALDQFKPDVLVSDIQMPGEDGFSFIRKVRQQERNHKERIPAAALTAHAGLEHRMRTLSAGFDIHLPKPVEPAELVAVIASLASRIGRGQGTQGDS